MKAPGRALLSAAIGAAFALVLAGCQAVERNPPLPGGGGLGGSGVGGDGGADPGQDAGQVGRVTGRVCLLIDLRDPTTCSLADASRYRVLDRAGGTSTITDSEGDFELAVDATTRVDLAIETNTADVEIVPALVPIPLVDGVRDGVIVPVFGAQDFDDLKLDLTLSSEPEAGTSTLVVHVVEDELPAPLVDLRDPIGASGVFYDDDLDPSGWAPNGVTGGLGAILTLGVDPSATSVLVGRDVDALLVDDIPFAPDTMTFAEITLDPARRPAP